MRNVLILGAGISGLGAAHVLLKHGVSVLISDLKDTIQDKKEKEALSERGAVFVFGTQTESLLDGIDTVVVSPVIPAENPIVAAAVKKGIPVRAGLSGHQSYDSGNYRNKWQDNNNNTSGEYDKPFRETFCSCRKSWNITEP